MDKALICMRTEINLKATTLKMKKGGEAYTLLTKEGNLKHNSIPILQIIQ